MELQVGGLENKKLEEGDIDKDNEGKEEEDPDMIETGEVGKGILLNVENARWDEGREEERMWRGA